MVSRCHAAALGREQRLFFGAIGVAVASILVWKSFDTCPFTQGALTSDNGQYVNQTGVIRAPEWKDDFDNARQERKLKAGAERSEA
jgi:hypothetical protein